MLVRAKLRPDHNTVTTTTSATLTDTNIDTNHITNLANITYNKDIGLKIHTKKYSDRKC